MVTTEEKQRRRALEREEIEKRRARSEKITEYTGIKPTPEKAAQLRAEEARLGEFEAKEASVAERKSREFSISPETLSKLSAGMERGFEKFGAVMKQGGGVAGVAEKAIKATEKVAIAKEAGVEKVAESALGAKGALVAGAAIGFGKVAGKWLYFLRAGCAVCV